MAFMAARYARDTAEFLAGRPPAWCLLTHSHFDHCGAVAFLKKRFPGMRVAASGRTAQVLARPGARDLMRRLSDASAAMAPMLGFPADDSPAFEAFSVDRTLADGDSLRLADDLHLQVIETPGHTRDCLSFYVPGRKILFSSEAVGIPDQTGYITTDCLVDYGLYRSSHARLTALEVEVLCLGHRAALTGDDARRHMAASLAQCERFRRMVGTLLTEEKGDIERVKGRVMAYEYDDKPEPKQPRPAYLLNLDARVRAIARLERSEG